MVDILNNEAAYLREVAKEYESFAGEVNNFLLQGSYSKKDISILKK